MGFDKKHKKDVKKDEWKPTKVIELKVALHCKKCVRKVLSSVSELRGVSRIDTDLEKSRVTVTGTVEEKDVIKKIEKLGKSAQPWKSSFKSDASKIKDAGLKYEQRGTTLIFVEDKPSNCVFM